MLGLPLLGLEIQLLDLLAQFALRLLGGLDVALELFFELFAGGLKVGEIGLELFVLFLVVVQLVRQGRAGAQRRRGHVGDNRAFLTAHDDWIERGK